MKMSEVELAHVEDLVREVERLRTQGTGTFLSANEVSELTGRSARKLQIEALRTMGIPFWVNAIGRPVVPRSAIEGKKDSAPPARKRWTPPD